MKFYFSILIALFFCQVLFAQDGNIKGKIIDKTTKQPLVGANVTIDGTSFGSSTDHNGYFLITNIPEDIYKIKANYIGYQSHYETDIRVTRGKTTYTREIALIPHTIEGEEVVVAAGLFNDDKNTPVSAFEFTRDEIIRAPGAAGDIFRAIETLPGVSSSGGEFSSFYVRGGSPYDNIILVDNIPFKKVAHFADGGEGEVKQGGRFGIFSTGLIDEANFQGGGFSAKYGSKHSSYLGLKIKEGNKENFRINGSYDLIGWELNYDGSTYIDKNTSILFSARHQDYKQILDIIGELNEGHPKFSDYVIKLTSDVHPNHKLSLLGLYSTEEFIRTVEHIYKAKEDEDLFTNQLRNHSEDSFLSGLNWRFLTGKNSMLNSTIYYCQNDFDHTAGKAYTDPINGIFPTEQGVIFNSQILNVENTETQIGLKLDYYHQFNNRVSLNAGIELERMKLKSNYVQNVKDTLYVFDASDYRDDPSQKYVVVDKDNFRNNSTNNFYTAFTEFSLSPILNLTLNFGMRYEYNDISKRNYIAPRVSGRYQFNPTTSFNFAVGSYFQNPTSEIIIASKNNNKLRNEKSNHFIFGMTKYLNNDLKLTCETYYKTFNNVIVAPDRSNNSATNNGDGWAYGIDFGLVKRLVSNFYGQVTYSYSKSKRNNYDGLGEYDYDFNQPHVFNIMAGYQLNDEWSFSAKWKYATGRPTDSYIINQNVLNNTATMKYSREIIGNNDKRFKDFHSLNFRVDYRQQFAKNFALIAYIDILNLYDHLNENMYDFVPANGEVKPVGLKMLPTFGLKIEL